MSLFAFDIFQDSTYPIRPKELPLEVRTIVRKLARNFDIEDDGSNCEWPKGKVLHKIFWTKKNLRKGNYHTFSYIFFPVLLLKLTENRN